jgi:anti-sigma regulatory factor (Ser/Thr protein kinase)
VFSPKPDFSITILSQTQLLKMVVELTRHIATLFQFPLGDAQKISLAIDEAVTNVIKHSYGNDPGGEISIEYSLAVTAMRIRILYRGLAPDISLEEVNLSRMIKKKKKGGLGVKLMKTIMDSVTYTTVDGENCCEMIKWRTAK